MKNFTKFMLRLIALGAAIGGVIAYLKKKGYISITTGSEDEDYDDFSSPDTEGTERTYINVDTDAMKEKAKEMAQDVKTKASEFAEKAQDAAEDIAEEIKDKAEGAYDEAKKMAKDASENIASALEKAWYEAEDKVEKVEEFFNDED